MSRIQPRPNNPRLERPKDVATEAQIDAMREKLSARCVAAGRQVEGVPDLKKTATAGGGNLLPGTPARPPSTRPDTSGGSETGLGSSQGNPTLQWERVSPYAMRTLCRTWTCSKVYTGGEVGYELWRVVAGLERPVCVRRGLDSFDQAKTIAQMEMEA